MAGCEAPLGNDVSASTRLTNTVQVSPPAADIWLLQTAEKRRRKSILLVDDDRGVRSAISQALKRSDYDLIEASSPDAAASVWSERRDEIDLVLLDILLPGLSGPELANEFLEQCPKSSIASIIYITGVGQENLKKFHLPKNARLLHKPFAVAELRELVESTLSQPNG